MGTHAAYPGTVLLSPHLLSASSSQVGHVGGPSCLPPSALDEVSAARATTGLRMPATGPGPCPGPARPLPSASPLLGGHALAFSSSLALPLARLSVSDGARLPTAHSALPQGCPCWQDLWDGWSPWVGPSAVDLWDVTPATLCLQGWLLVPCVSSEGEWGWYLCPSLQGWTPGWRPCCPAFLRSHSGGFWGRTVHRS